ncbi:MAG: MFS transporter [Actinomycetota bacterium]
MSEAAPTNTPNSNAPSSGLFYGWVVVGTVFVILTVTSGLGFYNASVILAAATDELGASVGAVSGGPALFFAISGLTGFVLSRQMDERDLRWFFLGGGILGAAALASLQFVESVVQLYAFFAVFGVGFALSGLVPATTLVTRWFSVRRSVALSIASTGLSVGGIALTPVAAWLIDRDTLAGAGPVLAVIWLIGVIPISLVLIRSRPADKGLHPDGIVPDSDATAAAARAGATFAQARTTRFFMLMCVTYALIFFAQVGGLAHLFNLAAERTDKTTAGTALSLLAFTSVLGRLAGGVIVLRAPTKSLSVVLTLFQGLALVALAFSTTPTSIIVSAILLGLSVGNLLMLQPLLLAEAFGVAEYSRIYSFNQLFGTLGVGGGPFALGLVHDVADYRVAFLVAAGASLIGFVTFLAAGPTSRALAIWAPGSSPSPSTSP